MVVPVDPDEGEAEDVDEQLRQAVAERGERRPFGAPRLRAVMVMMTAITPSLKASSRLVPTVRLRELRIRGFAHLKPSRRPSPLHHVQTRNFPEVVPGPWDVPDGRPSSRSESRSCTPPTLP